MKILLYTLLLCTFDAFACSCILPADPGKREYLRELKEADAVFIGTVVSPVDYQKSWDMTEQEVTLQVSETFKGAPLGNFKVSIGVCGFEFRNGKTYLIYSNRHDGRFWVSVCSFSKEYAPKSKEVIVLRKAANNSFKPNPLRRFFGRRG